MTFHLFRGSNGEWFWHLKAPNGRIIADCGEGYKRRSGALHGIRLVQGNAPLAAVVEQP